MDDPNESVPVSRHPFPMWFILLLNPHHSRSLLLQPPKLCCDKSDGSWACRSVGQYPVSSMHPYPRRLGSGACRAQSYKEGTLPSELPGAAKSASQFRAPVSPAASAVLSRTHVNNVG